MRPQAGVGKLKHAPPLQAVVGHASVFSLMTSLTHRYGTSLTLLVRRKCQQEGEGMPWKRVQMSEERIRFVIEASKPGSCMAALCGEFGISRQTGYLWLKRYQEGGAAVVLTELTRRPHESPQRASEAVVVGVREARLLRPDWGARKLARVIQATHPEVPSMSTTTDRKSVV